MEFNPAIRTRRNERQRLASHLAATVSYLWVTGLVSLVLGALRGAGMVSMPRINLARLVRPPIRVPSV